MSNCESRNDEGREGNEESWESRSPSRQIQRYENKKRCEMHAKHSRCCQDEEGVGKLRLTASQIRRFESRSQAKSLRDSRASAVGKITIERATTMHRKGEE